MTTRIVKVKKASIAALMLWVVLLCLGCKEVAKEIPDPCKPDIDEAFEVKVVIDYYRIETEVPDAPDQAAILLVDPLLYDMSTKIMTRVGKDHFQYACTLRANSNPKTETKAYHVAISDARREVPGTGMFMASELITVNGIELTKKAYTDSFAYKVFWLDKCTVITK